MTLPEAFGLWHAQPIPNAPAQQIVMEAMKADPALIAAIKADLARLGEPRGAKRLHEADYLSGRRHTALTEMLAAANG